MFGSFVHTSFHPGTLLSTKAWTLYSSFLTGIGRLQVVQVPLDPRCFHWERLFWSFKWCVSSDLYKDFCRETAMGGCPLVYDHLQNRQSDSILEFSLAWEWVPLFSGHKHQRFLCPWCGQKLAGRNRFASVSAECQGVLIQGPEHVDQSFFGGFQCQTLRGSLVFHHFCSQELTVWGSWLMTHLTPLLCWDPSLCLPQHHCTLYHLYRASLHIVSLIRNDGWSQIQIYSTAGQYPHYWLSRNLIWLYSSVDIDHWKSK